MKVIRRVFVARGFTLIEVMVTLTLLGMLVAVVFPNMSRWYAGLQRRQVLAQLQAQLQQLPAVAVFVGRDLSLADILGAQSTLALRYRVELPAGWVLKDAGDLRFLRTGQCRAGTATLQIAGQNVNVDVRLRPPMCDISVQERTIAVQP